MSKLIITRMNIRGVLCMICAVTEEQKILEIRIEPEGSQSLIGNIYVGQVETAASNIQAAFIRIAKDLNGYLPLKETENAVFVSGRKTKAPLRAGDELLVQVSRDAMKGKLPALTTDLNFTGKYLILTTGSRTIGYSRKLSAEDSALLHKWMEQEQNDPARGYGLILRTNAAEATKEELFHELAFLKKQRQKTVENGIHRTPLSLLYEAESFYITAVRDIYSQNLEEIVTDIPEAFEQVRRYLSDFMPDEVTKLRLYHDKLLPLYKLYRFEKALTEICSEKVWLKSGGFLVIQQTEAFVSIDVNTGKYTAPQKAEETYRKINLEAAAEISRQIRLRNLSGIILVDFINMSNPDHREELFNVLNKYLRRDPVKTRAVDVTALQITEITRKKVRRPAAEILLSLNQDNIK